MNANELIARAETLCRRRRIPFPSDLGQYARQWEREQFDLGFCWQQVKPMLSASQPLWKAEVEIRRHHTRLQSERDVRDRKAGEPLAPIPGAGEAPWWEDDQSPQQVSESPQEFSPSPASATVTGHPDGHRPSAEPRQTLRARRQPSRKRTDTLARRVREFLGAHVVRRGPVAALKLERMAKNEGLLQEDQSISRSSTFRRAMKELNIESHRTGYGPGASYIWRLKPAWTRGLDVHE